MGATTATGFGAFLRWALRSSVSAPRPMLVKKLMANLVSLGLSLGIRPSQASAMLASRDLRWEQFNSVILGISSADLSSVGLPDGTENSVIIFSPFNQFIHSEELRQFLKENLDKNPGAGCCVVLVKLYHLENFPANGVGMEEMRKEFANISVNKV